MGEKALAKELSCSFTGHRPSKMPWGDNELDPRCAELKRRLRDTIEAVAFSGITHFICGMAAGCDLYFCEAVIEIRRSNPAITIEAVIPWSGQADRWAAALREKYRNLLSACDYETLVQNHYDAECLMRRNRYMVDNSSILIAAYNGTRGGTMNTMLYAMRQGVEIIELPIEL